MKEIQLTKGYTTLVDDDDYNTLAKHRWYVLDSHPRICYAARWKPQSHPRIALRMHHIILGVTGKELTDALMVVDHIDRNGLNNQRYNLRIVNRTVNAVNSERCDNALGIYWDCYRGKFKAVQTPGRKFIGWFNTFNEAIEAKNAYNKNT